MVKKISRKQRIGIVVSDFNEFVTHKLLSACVSQLRKKGVNKGDIMVVHVPGAFEIPVVALKLAKKRNIDAVICLGAVIRGETYHYELVAQGVTFGVAQAALLTEKPIIFEVLATDTIELANARSKENGDNKGIDAADAALEMIKVLSNI